MSLSSHIEELESKHRNLDRKLDEERKSTSVSETELNTLKKEKLLLKDRIESLRVSLND